MERDTCPSTGSRHRLVLSPPAPTYKRMQARRAHTRTHTHAHTHTPDALASASREALDGLGRELIFGPQEGCATGVHRRADRVPHLTEPPVAQAARIARHLAHAHAYGAHVRHRDFPVVDALAESARRNHGRFVAAVDVHRGVLGIQGHVPIVVAGVPRVQISHDLLEDVIREPLEQRVLTQPSVPARSARRCAAHGISHRTTNMRLLSPRGHSIGCGPHRTSPS